MRLVSVLCVLITLALAGPARADMLVGIAHVEGLTGLNLEYMGERTSWYAVMGSHTGTNGQEADDFRWVAGYRKRLERAPAASPGFYGGLLVGDLGGRKQYERLGFGGELGHQWLTTYTRTTISGGFAALEEIEERDLDAEPTFFISLSWSIRR